MQAAAAHLVRYDIDDDRLVMDLVSGVAPGLVGPDRTPGHPFSLVVSRPAEGWLPAALSALEVWGSDGRRIDLERRGSRHGERMSVSDGATTAVFDLIAVG